MAKPNVLVVIGHPVVGPAIETLLRLERRYVVRRVTKLGDAAREARSWPAAVALVDAAMLTPPTKVTIGVPVIVLAGSDIDADAPGPTIEGERARLPKDASAPELVAALQSLLQGHDLDDAAGPLALAGVGALLVVLGALLLYLLWTAVV